MKDTIILKDGTTIELETGTLGALQVLSPDKAAMVATWDKFIPDNLQAVQIKNGEGTVISRPTDLVLVSETSTVAADGAVLTTYHLREKTELEKITERLAAVENGQEMNTDGILELAEIVGGKA